MGTTENLLQVRHVRAISVAAPAPASVPAPVPGPTIQAPAAAPQQSASSGPARHAGRDIRRWLAGLSREQLANDEVISWAALVYGWGGVQCDMHHDLLPARPRSEADVDASVETWDSISNL
jgi:hypothetical protein